MISIILPTHNRSAVLENCLKNLASQNSKVFFEIIVVLNNCTDNSREVAEKFSSVVIIDEPNTAFSKARNTGARAAKGDILLFLDDDAELWSNSIILATQLFNDEPNLGILAGRVEPRYEIEPPLWVIKCQNSHNALSLYRPNSKRVIGNVKVVEGAVGPCMAIRTKLYWEVGGFPPDTIGVETNLGNSKFSKWYIGPGDYGLCELVKKSKYFIGYHDEFGVNHIIPPLRLTSHFWISRFYGEGIYLAISDRQFWQLTKQELTKRKRINLVKYYIIMAKMFFSLNYMFKKEITPQKLETVKLLSYIAASNLCQKYPHLPSSLWLMGSEGVPDKDYTRIRKQLPNDFITLVEPDFNLTRKSRNPANQLSKKLNLNAFLNFQNNL